MSPEIPDKLYFKIGEVARLVDVPPHVLRYWESEFAAIKPRRANSGQRLYKRADVEMVLQLKIMLHEQGFSIAGAKNLLKSGKKVIITAKKTAGVTPAVARKPQSRVKIPRSSALKVIHVTSSADVILGQVKNELQALQKYVDSGNA
ncbi:MerR family transcriptional regulator [Desulforhopalus vacuolatus]|uniref:MerR family transcriptional regulator n=1 Tax=Desulforhopalus vacuolatus TaxID=40414 RepID=UPI0019646190|nr:MerR family transcriptional regulator [Desulforhopalus vacuolatus]MBM9519833.1 MerR family transcriptional regulator [Desulforhopalus vacuolatus]